MRKAMLLYNPASGGSRARQKEMEAARAVLGGAGVEAQIVPTNSPGHAGEEARRAIAAGCDTVFACGGDGTIHNIVQVLAKTPAVLGVLPMGTANTLAHDLRLPLNPIGAAQASLRAAPRRIPLGRVDYQSGASSRSTRYFIVAAGMGVDAHLFYKLHTNAKQRIGMAAYYVKAWHLWFSYPMTRFLAEYVEGGTGITQRSEVTELLSVRIRNFGKILQELAPGASLERDDMRIVACRTSSRWAYLAYVTRGLLRQRWRVSGIDLFSSASVSCRYITREGEEEQPKIFVEADGELLGTLPVELSVVPDALTLLMPAW
jgi:diacylglycerol kinase (ATP)